MVHSLWHARFKVEWAKKHLDYLGEQVAALTNTGDNRITTYDDVEQGQYVIKIQHASTPTFFKLILTTGDFVSCLRASLDHLAWQLALLTTPKPSGELTFPILEKNTVDAQVRLAKVTFGIPEPAIALMKSMQPYHAGDDYKSTHLWRLNKLWNIDKHRHLAGFREIPDTWEFNFSGIEKMESIPLSTEQIGDQTVMRLPLSLKEQVHFNPDVKVEFEINDASEGIVLRYKDLIDMYEFVDKTMFPAFAGFFPQTEVPGQSPEPIEF
jgi:antitoxin component of MazEF toxin-antitoxin module